MRLVCLLFLSFSLVVGCAGMDSSAPDGGTDVKPELTQKIVDVATDASHIVNTGMGYIDDYYAGVESSWYKPSNVERSDDGTYTFDYFSLSGYGIVSGTAHRSSWEHAGKQFPVVICDLTYAWTRGNLGYSSLCVVYRMDYEGKYWLYKIVLEGDTYLDI